MGSFARANVLHPWAEETEKKGTPVAHTESETERGLFCKESGSDYIHVSDVTTMHRTIADG